MHDSAPCKEEAVSKMSTPSVCPDPAFAMGQSTPLPCILAGTIPLSGQTGRGGRPRAHWSGIAKRGPVGS
jgi:hypothetical protein